MLTAKGFACVFNETICFPVRDTEEGAHETMRDVLTRAAMADGMIDSASIRIVPVTVTCPKDDPAS